MLKCITRTGERALIACGVVLFVFILIINLCFSAVKRKADAT